jgi:hypothetical protein
MSTCFYCDHGDAPEFMGDGYYHVNGAAIQAKCIRENNMADVITKEQVVKEFLARFDRVVNGIDVWWKRKQTPFDDLYQDELLEEFSEYLLEKVLP